MSSPPPGLIEPTLKSFAPGTNNARDSAIATQQNMNAKQANLNQAVTGGRKRKAKANGKGRKGSKLNILDWNKAISGGAASVVVPQLPLAYQPAGTNPNDVIKSTSSNGMQQAANSQYDNEAMDVQKGGSGNPNWNWGCLSGGKRRTRRARKTRKCKRKTCRRTNKRRAHH